MKNLTNANAVEDEVLDDEISKENPERRSYMGVVAKEKNNVIDISRDASTSKNKNEDESKPWYEYNDKGNAKFIEGILARHLIDTEKIFYCSGRFYRYEDGVYNEKLNEENIANNKKPLF